MEYWMVWVIVLAIGLLAGLIVHSFLKFAQSGRVLATLLMAMIGAAVGGFYVAQYVDLAAGSMSANRLLWAGIGGIILAVITELLMVGTRRGHIVST